MKGCKAMMGLNHLVGVDDPDTICERCGVNVLTGKFPIVRPYKIPKRDINATILLA